MTYKRMMAPMRAKRFLWLYLIAALLPICLRAGQPLDFQTGKLLEIGSDERVIDGTEYKRAIYQVQIGDLIYFGRGERITRSTSDPGHGLIVGDPVKVAINGDKLILERPDGKCMTTTIIKRVRADATKGN